MMALINTLTRLLPRVATTVPNIIKPPVVTTPTTTTTTPRTTTTTTSTPRTTTTTSTPRTTTSTPTVSYPTTSVSSATSTSSSSSSTPSWQQRLDQYSRDLAAAQQEILRAKDVYEQERQAYESIYGAGTFYNTDRAKQINQWANQVRQAAGISNDDSYYGNNPATYQGRPQGGGVISPPTLTPGGGVSGGVATSDLSSIGIYPTPTGGVYSPRPADPAGSQTTNVFNPVTGGWEPQVPAPQAPAYDNQTDMLIANLMELMGMMMNPMNNPQYQAMLNQARLQAARSAEERRNALNNLIDSLQGGQTSELEMLQSQLASTRQELEDDTFQKYLQARQAMANRGLAGSGLANEQDTRLLLARGRELARISQDAQARTNEIMRRYGNQLAQAQQQLAGISQSDLEAQLFQQMFQSGNQQLMDMAKIYLDLIGQTIGYDYVSKRDLLNLQFDYDKLASEERRALDKMTMEERQFYAQLEADTQLALAKIKADYDIRMTDIMGVDSQGRPTLDAMKLAEEIRKRQTSEAIDWAKLQLDSRALDQRIAQFDQQLALEYEKLAGTQWETQGRMLNNLINAKQEEMKILTRQIEALGSSTSRSSKEAREQLQAQLAEVSKEHQAYTYALNEIVYAASINRTSYNVDYDSFKKGVTSLWKNTIGKLFKKD